MRLILGVRMAVVQAVTSVVDGGEVYDAQAVGSDGVMEDAGRLSRMGEMFQHVDQEHGTEGTGEGETQLNVRNSEGGLGETATRDSDRMLRDVDAEQAVVGCEALEEEAVPASYVQQGVS